MGVRNFEHIEATWQQDSIALHTVLPLLTSQPCHPSNMHMSFKGPLCDAGSDGPAGNEVLNIFMEYAALGSLATVIKVSNCCTQASCPCDTALPCCNML
jgi:hypothetical protein